MPERRRASNAASAAAPYRRPRQRQAMQPLRGRRPAPDNAPVRQGGVQLRHLGRAGTFCRGEHHAGAAQAAQRVIHITGDIHLPPASAACMGAKSSVASCASAAPPGGSGWPCGIQRARAQRLQHAGAAVWVALPPSSARCAARLRQRGGDQLARRRCWRAKGRARCAESASDQRPRPFQSGRFTVAQHGKTRIDRRPAGRARCGAATGRQWR